MCDGNLREKLEIIKELVVIDLPAEPHEYMQEHLLWSIEELDSYRAGMAEVDPDGRERVVEISDT